MPVDIQELNLTDYFGHAVIQIK